MVWAVGSDDDGGGDKKRQRGGGGGELENHGKGDRGWGLINFRTGKHFIKDYPPIPNDWVNVVIAFGMVLVAFQCICIHNCIYVQRLTC